MRSTKSDDASTGVTEGNEARSKSHELKRAEGFRDHVCGIVPEKGERFSDLAPELGTTADHANFITGPFTPSHVTRQTVSSGTVWEDEVGYSRAVRIGDRVEVSGTTATDDDGDVVGVGDPYAQATQAIANVETALVEAGASLADVVRTRMFVTDVDHYDEVGKAHGEAFDEIRPATGMYEVAALVDPDMLVEIEAAAVVGE